MKHLKHPATRRASLALWFDRVRAGCTLIAAVAAIAVSIACHAAEDERPNFVVILADDLGYGDLGCYGADEIATPRIDQMAREGTRFTRAYAAAPFCSPSRAALLTGRLPARCGVPYVLFPAEHTGLPPDETTLAEVLKTRGYATACIGKWHLGWDGAYRPTRQGFDEFFGLPYSNDSNEWPVGQPFMQVMGLEPLPLVDGERVVEAPVDQSTLTRRYTERAVEFIRRNRQRPFFLYLPHTMPHIPQYASPEFAGRSRGGLYGDAVEELDWSVGRVLDTLAELNLSERTLVVFTSDNGASLQSPSRANAGSRFPGRSFGGSNAPLRAGKGTTFEGGVRVPFIAWRPGRVPAARVDDSIVSLMDLFPTIAALAGAPLPANRTFDGRDIGELLIGGDERTAHGESNSPPRHVAHYFGSQLQAIALGRWKLFVPIDRLPSEVPPSLWFEHQPAVFARQHRLWPAPTLYDLEADPGETSDVAADHGDVVRQLTALAAGIDAELARDARPMMMVEGPAAPAPAQVRTGDEDLSAWRTSRR